MKTVTSTITLLATLALGMPVLAGPEMPKAKLLDLYAIKNGDSVTVHIVANGDITEFLSDRKSGEDTYTLTLDVPALSPLDSKFDVETPFSRGFQVWPMQLGKKVYSRIEIELERAVSSVVGLENASHLVIRINADRPSQAAPVATTTPVEPPAAEPGSRAVDDPEPPVTATPLGVLPVDPPPVTEDGGGTEDPDPTSAEGDIGEPSSTVASAEDEISDEEEELFFNLFPTPGEQQQTLFNVAVEDLVPSETPNGLRVGRFALQPMIDASLIRGNNLLLRAEDTFVDTAYLIRGRLVATLLDSINQFKIAYEGRYRDFDKFTLEQKFTNFVDVDAVLQVTPSAQAKLSNHFVRGSFESQEFDPGGEIVASTDPFYRNYTQGVFAFDLSERLGAEINGSFNRVEFIEQENEFFSYDSRTIGGAVLYHLSPLTSLAGEYVRAVTPSPLSRPEAESFADLLLVGLRGEVTPMVRGEIRVGYASQSFPAATVPQNYRGFVADVQLTRDLGEKSSLTGWVGRRNNPSAFGENGFYTSNYFRARFLAPFAEKFRITANAGLFLNDYPVGSELALNREDDSFTSSIGLAYFFTPVSFVSVDYRHDRRDSTLDEFSYRNNAVQFMVGFGFLNR